MNFNPNICYNSHDAYNFFQTNLFTPNTSHLNNQISNFEPILKFDEIKKIVDCIFTEHEDFICHVLQGNLSKEEKDDLLNTLYIIFYRYVLNCVNDYSRNPIPTNFSPLFQLLSNQYLFQYFPYQFMPPNSLSYKRPKTIKQKSRPTPASQKSKKTSTHPKNKKGQTNSPQPSTQSTNKSITTNHQQENPTEASQKSLTKIDSTEGQTNSPKPPHQSTDQVHVASDPLSHIPPVLQEILKRKSSRDPTSRFTYKLAYLLNFVNNSDDKDMYQKVGCSWVKEDEFQINKQILANIMGIKINTLNVNLYTLGFVQLKNNKDGWTLWKKPNFTRTNNLNNST